MRDITKEWIDKAEQDFLVAEREHKEKPPAYDAVCFHCQQCMEKYFKAYRRMMSILKRYMTLMYF